VLVLFSLAWAPCSVHGATVIVSSLNETNDGNDRITPFLPGGPPGFEAAQEFTTGSNSYVLTQILANLGNFDPGTNNDFKLTATLQSDNSGAPSTGPPLATFKYDINSIPTAGFAHVAFDPIGTVSLMSGASYWFVLNGSSSDGIGGVDWSFTFGTTPEGPGTLPNFNTSNDDGTTWNGPFSGQPYQIEVSGNAVPEPASWFLGAIGLGGVFLAARWCRSRRRAISPRQAPSRD
jgi:hypothetical protein